jgi:S1-C subfamily serine protease
MAQSTSQITNPLAAFSDQSAQIVERVAQSIVAVQGGRRTSSSGIHWRTGVIVTAEETLERDEDISVTLPGGRQVTATLAGRDPGTDVAVLRIEPEGLALAETSEAGTLRVGDLVFAVGNHEGAPVANLGVASYVGSAWHSVRGSTIDQLLRLDLTLNRAAEGGALADVQGRVLGMTVFGPRRQALAIPTATINRSVEQLLTKGHVVRGYLGAGLQHVRLGRSSEKGAPDGKRGILVVSVDSDGPAAQAGLLVGDIITAWNAKPVERVRGIVRLLGPDSVGTSVDLDVLRGGAATKVKVAIGERPLT